MTALPVNIDELLKGQIVERERLEFKEGWNPEAYMRTVSAFANDANNWGGGYLIFGIKEEDGRPVFPPIGLSLNKIDAIQKEMSDCSYRIRPQYNPVLVPDSFQDKSKTHQPAGGESLPNALQSKIEKLNKRSNIEEIQSIICDLCAWKSLTAQEIAQVLNRKDKKHLVTQYLTPLVKSGKLKYVYPARGNLPNQAYTSGGIDPWTLKD